MPELPEVETIVRRLRGPLVGRTFTDVQVGWERMVQVPVAELEARLPGQRIEDINRRGKYLVFRLSEGDSLIVHLKMTGDLGVLLASEPTHQHDRLIFGLDNGYQLRFRDPRKFGRVYLTADPATILGRLGPEPLDDLFTEDDFLALFDRRSAWIKPLLLNQEFIAGLGNIYADEALFLAGIQPQRKSDTLMEEDKRRLYQAIRQVLSMAIELKGASLADEAYRGGEYQQRFLVYGRGDQPCPRCGSPIRRIWMGQRSAHFCSECQR
jgi:formamidopyrimidine-DNA glycosylase